jgi:hypothetical protein
MPKYRAHHASTHARKVALTCHERAAHTSGPSCARVTLCAASGNGATPGPSSRPRAIGTPGRAQGHTGAKTARAGHAEAGGSLGPRSGVGLRRAPQRACREEVRRGRGGQGAGSGGRHGRAEAARAGAGVGAGDAAPRRGGVGAGEPRRGRGRAGTGHEGGRARAGPPPWSRATTGGVGSDHARGRGRDGRAAPGGRAPRASRHGRAAASAPWPSRRERAMAGPRPSWGVEGEGGEERGRGLTARGGGEGGAGRAGELRGRGGDHARGRDREGEILGGGEGG